MASDLDRRCQKQVRDLEERIEKISNWLSSIARCRMTKASAARVNAIAKEREALIVDLYDMKRCHAAYDARLEEAREDPTGQDLDAFYDAYGEGDEPIKPEY